MSIRASKITPIATRNRTLRRCDRCGIDWRDPQNRFSADSPCKSCRDVLTDLDGIPRAYWIPEEQRNAFEVKQFAEWLKAQEETREQVSA